VTGVAVDHLAGGDVQDATEYRHKDAGFVAFCQFNIDPPHDFVRRGIDAGIGFEQGPRDRHEERGRNPLPRHVANGEEEVLLVDEKEIEEVPSHFPSGLDGGEDVEFRPLGKGWKGSREDAHLNFAGNFELAFDAFLGRSRLLQVAEVLPQRVFHEEQGFCKIADFIPVSGRQGADGRGKLHRRKIVFRQLTGVGRQFLERLRNPSDQKEGDNQAHYKDQANERALSDNGSSDRDHHFFFEGTGNNIPIEGLEVPGIRDEGAEAFSLRTLQQIFQGLVGMLRRRFELVQQRLSGASVRHLRQCHAREGRMDEELAIPFEEEEIAGIGDAHMIEGLFQVMDDGIEPLLSIRFDVFHVHHGGDHPSEPRVVGEVAEFL